ncbi:LexA family protein [Streptomyces cyaneofuscatus]
MCPGDTVTVQQTPTARHGDILAALLDNEASVKRLHQQDSRMLLTPHHLANEPIPERARPSSVRSSPSCGPSAIDAAARSPEPAAHPRRRGRPRSSATDRRRGPARRTGRGGCDGRAVPADEDIPSMYWVNSGEIFQAKASAAVAVLPPTRPESFSGGSVAGARSGRGRR